MGAWLQENGYLRDAFSTRVDTVQVTSTPGQILLASFLPVRGSRHAGSDISAAGEAASSHRRCGPGRGASNGGGETFSSGGCPRLDPVALKRPPFAPQHMAWVAVQDPDPVLLEGIRAVSVRGPCSCVAHEVAPAGIPEGTDDAMAAGRHAPRSASDAEGKPAAQVSLTPATLHATWLACWRETLAFAAPHVTRLTFEDCCIAGQIGATLDPRSQQLDTLRTWQPDFITTT